MSQTIRVAFVALVAFLVFGTPAFAQAGNEGGYGIVFSGAIGAAVTIIGAGWGIGRIGATAVESMARQPEVAGNIQTAMIISAALIEGVTLFALVVCILQGDPFPAAAQ